MKCHVVQGHSAGRCGGNSMIHIPWKERYNIHYKNIDEQHKVLLVILNELVDLINLGASADQVTVIYRKLCQYATLHFSTEERYLRASGYGGLVQEQQEHAWFIEKLVAFDKFYELSDPSLLDETMRFLKNWYVGHIMRLDQDYVECVQSFYRRAKIRGVIFDFSNVIAQVDKNGIADRLSSICGVPSAEIRGRFQAEASLDSDFETGSISPAQFLEQVSFLCGHGFSEAEFIPIFTEIFTAIESTRELIRKLKGRYRLGLIANTNPWHFQHGIQTSEVFPLFDAVTLSFQVKARKPNSILFLDALEKLDLVAEECVYIDGNAEFVAAANGCLLHGIHYRGGRELLRDLKSMKISI